MTTRMGFLLPLFFLLFCLPCQAGAAMKIGILPASDTLALHVAYDEGLFSKHGLDVELVPFQSSLEQSAAVRAGALQGWFTDPIAMLVMHESGVAQHVIATLSRSGPEARFFGIAASPASDIFSLEQLKGKEVAISKATIIEYMLDSMLQSKGLERNFVKRLDIKQISVRLQLLMAGKTDAALLPEPLLSLVLAKGARLIMDNTGLDVPLVITALRRDASRPEEVRAFRAALAEAMDRINAEPEKYRKVMLAKKLLPEEASPQYRMPRSDPANTPLPVPTKEELERIAAWMTENKILRKMPVAWDMVHDDAK